MSKIFDNIETKFEEWLYAIPGSGDRTWLLKIGNMSLMSPKKAFELTMNCAGLKAAAKKRIDHPIGMAGIKYILNHVELAEKKDRSPRL